jgi:septal ring factor EnvC (AmiA/AmiB activator)
MTTTATTTTATTSAAPFAGFATLLARVQRSGRNPSSINRTHTDDRDRQRLLDDLRALSDTRSDFATACACRRSGR